MSRGRWLLLPALALLAGCSALKLTYNKLDWVAAWQVGRFVELQPSQKALFDERFHEFWQWHRGTQLTLYVQDLRELAAAGAQPLTTVQVEAFLSRGTGHLARAMRELVPDMARVMRTFDEAQVEELLERLAKRRREQAEESAELTAAELKEAAEEQMERNLKRWIGSLTRDQQRRVRDWSHERQYAGTIWHQYQEAWAGAFTEVLAHRQAPDFEQRLAELFGESRLPYREEMARVQAHNRRLSIELMADLSAMLTPEQREHFREKVLELAKDLDTLAARDQRAALPGIIG